MSIVILLFLSQRDHTYRNRPVAPSCPCFFFAVPPWLVMRLHKQDCTLVLMIYFWLFCRFEHPFLMYNATPVYFLSFFPCFAGRNSISGRFFYFYFIIMKEGGIRWLVIPIQNRPANWFHLYGGPRINIGGPEDVGIVNNFRANQADRGPQYCIVRRAQEVLPDSHQAAYTRKINYP